MKNLTPMSAAKPANHTPLKVAIVTACAAICAAAAADGPWSWSGSYDNKTVTLLLLGDFNVQQRVDPTDALLHVRETLNRADLAYGNLEGLLVKSAGPDKDLPDKTGWQHLGPEAVLALKAGNVKAVGVANNVGYGHANVIKSLRVLDANQIAHTGGGENIDEAHKPAIVESRGVKFGFLQYTAKWYEEAQQIATANTPGAARVLSKDGLTVDPTDLARVCDDIRRLRPLVDFVIVSSHTRDGQGRGNSSGRISAVNATPPREPDLFSQLPVNPKLSEAEPYEKELAHAAIDAGADVVYGHGCHVLQGVEVYKGKPIMYCMGNFVSDWIRVRKYKEGMVARVVVEDKSLLRLSLVPVTRDDNNDVLMLDPATGEGAKLIQKVRDLSGGVPLRIDGQEAVLVEKNPMNTRR